MLASTCLYSLYAWLLQLCLISKCLVMKLTAPAHSDGGDEGAYRKRLESTCEAHFLLNRLIRATFQVPFSPTFQWCKNTQQTYTSQVYGMAEV